MNEGAATRERVEEFIQDDVPFDYEKYKFTDEAKYIFYLRFIKEHFTPCKECQKTIDKLITESQDFFLGNKDYEPPVEFRRTWGIIHEEKLEQRKSTKQDYKNIYGHRWESYWNAHVEGEKE